MDLQTNIPYLASQGCQAAEAGDILVTIILTRSLFR